MLYKITSSIMSIFKFLPWILFFLLNSFLAPALKLIFKKVSSYVWIKSCYFYLSRKLYQGTPKKIAGSEGFYQMEFFLPCLGSRKNNNLQTKFIFPPHILKFFTLICIWMNNINNFWIPFTFFKTKIVANGAVFPFKNSLDSTLGGAILGRIENILFSTKIWVNSGFAAWYWIRSWS